MNGHHTSQTTGASGHGLAHTAWPRLSPTLLSMIRDLGLLSGDRTTPDCPRVATLDLPHPHGLTGKESG